MEKKRREKDGTRRRRKTGVREKEFGSAAAASTCSIIHSFVSFLSSTLLPSSIFRCFQMYTIHEIGRYIDVFVPKVNSSQRWNHRRKSSGIDRWTDSETTNIHSKMIQTYTLFLLFHTVWWMKEESSIQVYIFSFLLLHSFSFIIQ